MAGRDLEHFHAVGLYPVAAGLQRSVDRIGAGDIDRRQAVADLVGEPQRGRVGPERMRGEARLQPRRLRRIGDTERARRRCRYAQPAARLLGRLHARRDDFLRQHAEHALAVLEHDRVQVDQLADAVGHLVCSSRNGVAAKAVTDKDHVPEVFPFQDIDDIGYERVERDRLGYQVGTFTEPGLGRGENGVAARTQDGGDLGPAPSAVPGAVNQDERLCRRPSGDVRCCRTRRNGRGHRQKGPTIHWEPPRVVLLFAPHSAIPGRWVDQAYGGPEPRSNVIEMAGEPAITPRFRPRSPIFINKDSVACRRRAKGSFSGPTRQGALQARVPHGDQRTVTFFKPFRRAAIAAAAAAVMLPTGLAAQGPTAMVASPSPTSQELARVSLWGNYLAARHAGLQRDIGSAAAYYRAALRVDPKNNELLERAFLSIVADGEVDEAVKLAERLVQVDPSHRIARLRSEEHTSELQSLRHLVCRLLLEKKK